VRVCHKNLFAAAGVIGLLALGSVRPALADVYVTDVEFSVGNSSTEDTVYIWGNGFGSYEDVYTGQLTFTVGNNSYGPNGELAVGSTVPVWCVDIYHDIGLGTNGGQQGTIDYKLGTLANNGDGTNLTQQQINAMSWLIVAGDAYLSSHASVDVSGAIQLALWDLEYGSTYGGTGFDYKNASSSNMVSLAKSYINSAWANKNNNAYDSYIYTLTNPDVQSFAFAEMPTNPPQLVPEPGSLAILGGALLGLAGIWHVRRRRDRCT
jgi:hypothetical protein